MSTNLKLKEEAFRKALNGLMKQGHAARTSAHQHAMLTESGDRCAIGFLVPVNTMKKQELYAECGYLLGGAGTFAAMCRRNNLKYSDLGYEFTASLVSMHDSASHRTKNKPEKFMAALVDEANVVAIRYGLNRKIVDRLVAKYASPTQKRKGPR